MALLGAVLNDGGFRRHLIFIEDIGPGGLRFRSDVPYRKHDVIKIHVRLNDSEHTVKAEIRHVVSDWLGYACGVQFLHPDPSFVQAVSVLFVRLCPEGSRIPA